MIVDPGSWLQFAEVCERVAATRSKLAKRAVMAEYLRPLDAPLAGLAAQYLAGAVFPETDARKLQIGGQLIVRALEKITSASLDTFYAVYRKYGDLGSAGEELLQCKKQVGRGLSLQEVSSRFDSLAEARVQTAKQAQLMDVLRAFAPVEAKYFIKLVLGDMRTGVKQSLVEEAIAAAAQENLAAVRRAGMLLGNLPAVVALAWQHKLSMAQFQMFHPLGFMLATPAANAKEAYARLMETPDREGGPTGSAGPLAQIEDKYDGMRAQVHCGDPLQRGRVRIFSRNREDVTESFPELAEWFAAVDAPAILDGEILAWDFFQDRALPFTALQQRLGRKRVTAAMREDTPLVYMGFDILLSGKDVLLDQALSARRTRLMEWAEAAWQVPRTCGPKNESSFLQTGLFETEAATEFRAAPTRLKISPVIAAKSPTEVDEAFDAAQARGNEGLMLKALDSVYQPGRRGLAWLKLKRELATLDVVVTSVEYGHGRRAAMLSDYMFAVRNNGELLNVGKAYSGLTDAEIMELTEWFLAHTLDSAGSRRIVEPKIVLEVAFNNVMQSDRHNSGYALRFPRIVRVRSDKPVEEIDTLRRVEEIFHAQHNY